MSGGSRDRHRPASPASPERSRRPRRARGARRGADRGGEAARTPPPAHLLRRPWPLVALVAVAVSAVLRPRGTAGDRFAGARRTIQWSGRERRRRRSPSSASLSTWATRGVLCVDEPRRERAATGWPTPFGHALVARWSEDRLRGRGQPATSDIYVMNADGSGQREADERPRLRTAVRPGRPTDRRSRSPGASRRSSPRSTS